MSSPPSNPLPGGPVLIRPAAPGDASAIDTMLDAAFGPGRHARTASRLRVGAVPLAGPSLVAHGGGVLLGSVQLWPVALDSTAGRVSLTLLGPLAVAPQARAIGLGRRLLAAALVAADVLRLDTILLIGDLAYYGPFGFSADATGGWTLPGPVERERVLLRQRTPRPLPRIADVVAASTRHDATGRCIPPPDSLPRELSRPVRRDLPL